MGASSVLLALEGIDGAGKKTQSELLKAKALSLGLSAAILAFPRYGETTFSIAVADYLNGKFGDLSTVSPYFSALLFAGDRFESRPTIIQLLETHDLLILDRYVASNLVYQAARLKPEDRPQFMSWVARIEYEVYSLPHADLTVYLDVPAEVASKMIARKGDRAYTDCSADLHEKDSGYLAACREVYREVAEMDYGGKWLSVECTDCSGNVLDALQICDSIWSGIRQSGVPLPTC